MKLFPLFHYLRDFRLYNKQFFLHLVVLLLVYLENQISSLDHLKHLHQTEHIQTCIKSGARCKA